jgi:NAD+ diphosphatase
VSELPFSGASIDRAGELRSDPERLSALLARGGARAICGDGDGVMVEDGALARVAVTEVGSDTILLGIENGHPLLAQRSESPQLTPLRDAGAVLPPEESGLAAYLVSLLQWHATHRFCPNCGGPTELREGGMSRRCERCGRIHFPRTDPVVIMAVTDGERLLMGRRAGSPQGRYSVLAGFVSPGETAEAAVVREVREESGIEVTAARYWRSQPWPFPSSLMLGFIAETPGGEPRVADGELAEVRWFERDEILAAERGEGDLQLPGEVSIARALVRFWADPGRSGEGPAGTH